MACAYFGEAMRHFFLDQLGLINDPVDVHHISRVLRMNVGDRISCAYNGNRFVGEIESISKTEVEVKLLEKIEVPTYPEIHLYQALAKGQKLEAILQHGTELGISKFGLFPSEFSDIKKVDKKRDRYERIIKDAAKQSQGSFIPKLDFYNGVGELEFDENYIFLCYEAHKETHIKLDGPGSVAIIIGPEGGFSKEEVDYLSQKAKLVSLGTRILRTETAGLVATTAVLKELGIL